MVAQFANENKATTESQVHVVVPIFIYWMNTIHHVEMQKELSSGMKGNLYGCYMWWFMSLLYVMNYEVMKRMWWWV